MGDSLRQVTTGYNKIPIGETPYTYVIDTIVFIGYGAAINVTLKVKYGASMADTGYSIVYAGNAITSVTTPTKISSFNRTEIPAGQVIWVQPTAITTRGTIITTVIKGHRKP